MKKILFLTVRDPFSGRFSGDVIRSKKFVEYFAKKNNVQVLALGKNNSLKNSKRLSVRLFKNENFFIILFRCLISLLRSKPLHLNFFYSSALKRYLKLNIKSYDLIFCQSIRSFQYLPEIKKNIILDVGDLYSKNYYQTYKNLFFFNPLKFIYYIESKLVKKYEQLCFSKSNKILLFSKKEIQEIKNVPKNKKIQINFGIDKIKKIYKFSKTNYKIVFIGNIKYAPNRQACIRFIKDIFPKIKKLFPNIEFHILGEIYLIDKYFFMKKPGVHLKGKIKNLEPYLSNVICGLANLNISTGVQTKLLTYMSYGIPSICSKKVYENFDKVKSNKINYYKNDEDLLNLIVKMTKDSSFCNKISNRSIKTVQNFKWQKVLKTFDSFI